MCLLILPALARSTHLPPFNPILPSLAVNDMQALAADQATHDAQLKAAAERSQQAEKLK
jgi:hypothetical protein